MRKSTIIILGIIILTFQFTLCEAQFFNEQGLKFIKLFNWIETQYVDTVNLDKISDEAIRETLHKLDPHSVYITKDEVREMNEPLQGNFEGIGVSFSIYKDSITVISCIPGGPSYKVGISAGDRIVMIDNDKVAGIGITKKEVFTKLRGKKGTQVSVQIFRRGTNGLLSFTITRDKIPIESIDASFPVDKNTGYIRLSRFSATTADEVLAILKSYKSKGIENIVLDLSGNSGGYLDMAVTLADQFLDSGKKIVYTEGIHSEKKEYFSTASGFYKTGKLVVIINENSASASEILAGAIQDWDRGLIIGRRSYGKGLVQRPFVFPDGSMVRLTIARYYTPSGRLIQKSYAGGYKSYANELNTRYKDGELFGLAQDSLPDSLKYFTLKQKRIVYGGGGITPDVYIPIDTTNYTQLFRSILAQGILGSYAMEYIDKNRNNLKLQYPTFQLFKANFEVNTTMLDEFSHLLINRKINVIDEELEKSKTQIATLIKANIAQDLWSLSEFYEIYNSISPDFLKAIEIIKNWDKYSN